MTQTTQINIRLEDSFLGKARKYAQKHGFSNVQELLKESLREKLFDEPMITKEELVLVKKLAKATEEKNLWGTEDELFQKLRR
jgi:Arc/MetJ-type ribon-helix-helix transcriptional regulator